MTSLEAQMKAWSRMTKAKAINERIQLEEMNLIREQMLPLEEIAARKQAIADLRVKLVNPSRYKAMMLARERGLDDEEEEEEAPTPEEDAALVFSDYTRSKAMDGGLTYDELSKWKRGNSVEFMERLANKFDMPGKERKAGEDGSQYMNRQKRAFNKLFGINKVSYPDDGRLVVTNLSGKKTTIDGSLVPSYELIPTQKSSLVPSSTQKSSLVPSSTQKSKSKKK
jgi:hypothetical protein